MGSMSDAFEAPTPIFSVGRLTSWFADRLGAPVSIADLSAVSQGFSNETWTLTALYEGGQRSLVLRLAPSGQQLFPDTDLRDQVALLDALRLNTALPVATVLWSEFDAGVLGRVFYVMDRVPGRIPNDTYMFDGWVRDLAPLAQSELQTSMLSTLAEIHRVDWKAAGLDSLRVGIDGQLEYWAQYLEWASIGSEGLQAALHWCRTHRPRDEPDLALTWGDARLGNLVVNEDLSVRAILDWEMASLGPPELDLGWYLLLERVARRFGGHVDGFCEPGAAIARYEQHLGRAVRDLAWYEIWAGVRAGAINARRGILETGSPPSFDPMLTTIDQLMADFVADG